MLFVSDRKFARSGSKTQEIKKVLTKILTIFHLIESTVNGDRHRSSFLGNNDRDRITDLTCADCGSVSRSVTLDHVECLGKRNMASCGNDPAVTDQKCAIVHRRSFIEDRLQHGVRYRRIQTNHVFLLQKLAEFRGSFQKHDRARVCLTHLGTCTDDLVDHGNIAELIFRIITDDRALEG